jgi:hypothetical protein
MQELQFSFRIFVYDYIVKYLEEEIIYATRG